MKSTGATSTTATGSRLITFSNCRRTVTAQPAPVRWNAITQNRHPRQSATHVIAPMWYAARACVIPSFMPPMIVITMKTRPTAISAMPGVGLPATVVLACERSAASWP
jgi:hypothetical protein